MKTVQSTAYRTKVEDAILASFCVQLWALQLSPASITVRVAMIPAKAYGSRMVDTCLVAAG